MNRERPLNILVLHGMGRRTRWFAGVADVELMFPRYDAANRYVVHNCYYPCPAVLSRVEFDGVIMMSTFMDWVTREGLDSPWVRQYRFLKDTAAVKVVFPQDDYWYSELRDAFYTDWGIDLVHPVCPPETWPDLIPRYLASGRKARLGFTTYVTEYTRRIATHAKAWDRRKWDVVYRATKIPKAPNRYGIVKGELGDRFASTLPAGHPLRLNISTDPKDLIRGKAWYDFIGDSRGILGSNSGSSIRLRNHAVRDALNSYRTAHPAAPLDEVEKHVIAPEDRNKEYTAISPRNVEAAALGTVQLLVPGPYSGLLAPGQDYIELAEDCSNAAEVLGQLKDRGRCLEITASAREKMLEAGEVRAETTIDRVIATIRERHGAHPETLDHDRVRRAHAAQVAAGFLLQLPAKVSRVVARRIPGVSRLS